MLNIIGISRCKGAFASAKFETVIIKIEDQLLIMENYSEKYKKDTISTQKEMWKDLTIAPSSFSDLEDIVQAWLESTYK